MVFSLETDTITNSDLIMVSSPETDAPANSEIIMVSRIETNTPANPDLIMSIFPLLSIFSIFPCINILPLRIFTPSECVYLPLISLVTNIPFQSISPSEYLLSPAFFPLFSSRLFLPQVCFLLNSTVFTMQKCFLILSILFLPSIFLLSQ